MLYIAVCDLPSSIQLWKSLIKISIAIVAKSKLPTGLNLMTHNQREARMHLFVAASERAILLATAVCASLQSTISSCF